MHRSWLRARPERTFADKALYELTISTCALPNAIRAARRADVIVCVVPTLLAATLRRRLGQAPRQAACSLGTGPRSFSGSSRNGQWGGIPSTFCSQEAGRSSSALGGEDRCL